MSNNLREEMNQVVAWIKSTVENAGAKGVVLGLSGGIDSAVVGALAVEALGKDYVLPVTMPVVGTKAHMDQGAADMFKHLDKMPLTITIDPTVFDASYILYRWDPEIHKVRVGNTAARMRMIHLYNLAHSKDYLVIGTENRTEMILGYCTKHGDGASDFEPLKGFSKTEVIEMAKLLELPETVTGREPSAELWEGQTDEKELGGNYVEDIDPYLEWLEQDPESPGACPVSDELKQSLYNRIRANAHKSAPIPMFERTYSILSLSEG